MPYVPGLRSPYVRVGRLVYFGRMLDKIRLAARGSLPTDYHPWLGKGFDARTCRFLGIAYADLRQHVLSGAGDEEVLEWAQRRGPAHSDAECDVWNGFMMKRGWRDDGSAELRQRVHAQNLTAYPIDTYFDLIEYDEGRDAVRRRAWELRPTQIVLLMGVAGSGKTTIGQGLADELGWRFADADDFHPATNVAKMRDGQPLTDADRGPWLEALRAFISARLHEGVSTAVACSALKARYRDLLLVDPSSVLLVYLKGPPELLRERLAARRGHYMPVSLLESQLAALEEPEPAAALTCDIADPPTAIIAQIRAALEA